MYLTNPINKEYVLPKIEEYRDSVITFDLGGTFFRSGIYTPKHGVRKIHQEPAISFYNMPNIAVDELKKMLVNYLVKKANEYAAYVDINSVAISLGAALDGNKSIVYGSGPLWGSDNQVFDLLSALKKTAPEFKWHITNDLTAGLIHYASHVNEPKIRKILLVTISTGIACRVLDTRTNHIALDEFGLQGEIGHLPVTLNFEGKILESECDCGGKNHLSAFASGRGVEKLKQLLIEKLPDLWHKSQLYKLSKTEAGQNKAFLCALDLNDEFSSVLLYLATKNLAEILRNALTLDPEIDHIVLTGGMVVNLKEHYSKALAKHFSEQGIYLTSQFDPYFFERRLKIVDDSEVNNMIGAAMYSIIQTKGKNIHE